MRPAPAAHCAITSRHLRPTPPPSTATRNTARNAARSAAQPAAQPALCLRTCLPTSSWLRPSPCPCSCRPRPSASASTATATPAPHAGGYRWLGTWGSARPASRCCCCSPSFSGSGEAGRQAGGGGEVAGGRQAKRRGSGGRGSPCACCWHAVGMCACACCWPRARVCVRIGRVGWLVVRDMNRPHPLQAFPRCSSRVLLSCCTAVLPYTRPWGGAAGMHPASGGHLLPAPNSRALAHA